MKRQKVSLILNIINVALVLFAALASTFDFNFMQLDNVLVENDSLFQFYTFDSNLLMGIVSLIYVTYLILLINKKIEKMPKVVEILKLVSTTAVGVTFFTVVLILAPFTNVPFYLFFTNSNLIFHLIVPVISMVSLIVFEDMHLKFVESLYSLSTVIVYGIYYTINVFVHMVDGKVDIKYDWYGFAQNGMVGIIISIIAILSLTFGISTLLYFVNKKINEVRIK